MAITDHQLLLTSIPLERDNLPQRTIWDWKSTDWELLEDEVAIDLQSAGLLPADDLVIFATSEIDNAIEIITKAITSAMLKATVQKRITSRSRSWYDADVKAAHLRMKQTTKEWKKSPTDEHRLQKTLCTAEYRQLAQQKKQNSFRHFCQSC